MKGIGSSNLNTLLTFRIKTPAVKTQAAPVQNTWYVILDTTANCRIHGIRAQVATAGETLEVKIAVDGVDYASAKACNADTPYFWSIRPNDTPALDYSTSVISANCQYHFIEGRSVKISFRKTTNTGAGDILGIVIYSVRD